MHNLKTNFHKFIGITKSFFSGQINQLDNFQYYLNPPKISDCQIIALTLTAESIGIDSENYFFDKLKSDYLDDKGYLSKQHQLDLFFLCNIRLETPRRSNQKDKEPFAYVFKKSRKRIEKLFFQLCDRFTLRNYVKPNLGISVRILFKITAVTVLQYFKF